MKYLDGQPPDRHQSDPDVGTGRCFLSGRAACPAAPRVLDGNYDVRETQWPEQIQETASVCWR